MPNSSFVFPVGQAISRTTYSALFAIMGTTHGSGDGSTTFNLPDKRGRVVAAPDPMAAHQRAALRTLSLASILSATLAAIKQDAGNNKPPALHAVRLGQLWQHRDQQRSDARHEYCDWWYRDWWTDRRRDTDYHFDILC